MNPPHPISSHILQAVEAVVLLTAAIFLTLHSFHLSADFPKAASKDPIDALAYE
jgi:hypothetical protein